MRLIMLLIYLAGEKVPGIHLNMAADNKAAGKFYEKVGFEKFDEGIGGERGKIEPNGICYVMSLN